MSVPERNNNSDLIKLKRNELSLGKIQASACPDIGQPGIYEIVDFRWNKHFSSVSQTLLLDFPIVLNHNTYCSSRHRNWKSNNNNNAMLFLEEGKVWWYRFSCKIQSNMKTMSMFLFNNPDFRGFLTIYNQRNITLSCSVTAGPSKKMYTSLRIHLCKHFPSQSPLTFNPRSYTQIQPPTVAQGWGGWMEPLHKIYFCCCKKLKKHVFSPKNGLTTCYLCRHIS